MFFNMGIGNQMSGDGSEGEDTVKFILLVCPKKLDGCYIQDKYKGSFMKRKRNEKVISTMGRGRVRGCRRLWKAFQKEVTLAQIRQET